MITLHTEAQQHTIIAVELKDIGKRYALRKAGSIFKDFWALKEVSLEIIAGQIFGIIGRNGAGKTTLLNIIAGTLSPTEGTVAAKGRVVGLFNLGTGFEDELTGRENIFLNGAVLGASRKELEGKLRDIIDFSELGNFIDMPLGSYSQGMRLRLGFSIIANMDFDVLVIDEILAVGDSLFQSKCFERLVDFKREGKTLVITTQDMGMIERLCDRAVLLDHGRLLHYGVPLEAINSYSAILKTEKFFVGPDYEKGRIVENTKRWGDQSDWGKRLGTKEVIIKSVDFINKFGQKCKSVRSRDSLKVKASFFVKNHIKNPHFGVAVFRKDGVYCYGPNTAFDGYDILELNKGRGHFVLTYKELQLAPGEYRFSVAVWDKNETLAFDYCIGYYKFMVTGNPNHNNQLLNIPYRVKQNGLKARLAHYFGKKENNGEPDLSGNNWIDRVKDSKIKLGYLKMFDSDNKEKDIFMTNESAIFLVSINGTKDLDSGKDLYLWLGIYRDDGIYCQGINAHLLKDAPMKILLPRLSLLPGGYTVSLGVWSGLDRKFMAIFPRALRFKMMFDREDHGTVYLEHEWKCAFK